MEDESSVLKYNSVQQNIRYGIIDVQGSNNHLTFENVHQVGFMPAFLNIGTSGSTNVSQAACARPQPDSHETLQVQA